MRIYGNRWSIECFFKASKSFLKLGSEFQSRSYGAMVSHTTIVFTRYIILEWLNRNQNDEKTYGELFFMYCEDIQDMDLTNAHCPVKYFLYFLDCFWFLYHLYCLFCSLLNLLFHGTSFRKGWLYGSFGAGHRHHSPFSGNKKNRNIEFIYKINLYFPVSLSVYRG